MVVRTSHRSGLDPCDPNRGPRSGRATEEGEWTHSTRTGARVAGGREAETGTGTGTGDNGSR